MNILFLGDISGRPGREAVEKFLPEIKKNKKIDFVIANAENAAGGRGITKNVLQELQSFGIDFFTSGEHVWDIKEFREDLFDKALPIVRPYNYEKTDLLPGYGYKKLDLGKTSIVIISLIGQTFMRSDSRNAFWAAEELFKEKKKEWEGSIIIVDFHAEATSEKLSMGHFLKNKATAVLGTHTHVGTIDARLMEDTAYVTDVGMNGPWDASLWVKFEDVIHNFKYPFKTSFNMEDEKGIQFNSVLIEISPKNNEFGAKKAKKISRLDKFKS